MSDAKRHRIGRAIEFCILFVGLPIAYRFGLVRLHIIVLLITVAAGCMGVLLMDGSFDRRRLWNSQAIGREWKRIAGQYVVCSLAMWVAVSVAAPEALYSFIKHRPALYVIIMIFYPLVSAYPQEVIYRAFFFHRYRGLFPNSWLLVGVNAAAFGFMHVVYGNWIAVALSAVGGVFFGVTYLRSGSTLAAAIEHSLYGWLIFTVGLGGFFYNGGR